MGSRKHYSRVPKELRQSTINAEKVAERKALREAARIKKASRREASRDKPKSIYKKFMDDNREEVKMNLKIENTTGLPLGQAMFKTLGDMWKVSDEKSRNIQEKLDRLQKQKEQMRMKKLLKANAKKKKLFDIQDDKRSKRLDKEMEREAKHLKGLAKKADKDEKRRVKEEKHRNKKERKKKETKKKEAKSKKSEVAFSKSYKGHSRKRAAAYNAAPNKQLSLSYLLKYY